MLDVVIVVLMIVVVGFVVVGLINGLMNDD